MEFRITSIIETYPGQLVLELENTQRAQQADGVFRPTARLTATVPDEGEFHGLTIGQVLRFGEREEDATIAYDPYAQHHAVGPKPPSAFDPCAPTEDYNPAREGHWKSPTVVGRVPIFKDGYWTGDSTFPDGCTTTSLPPGGCTSSSVNTEEPKPSENWIGPGFKKRKP